MAVIFYLCKLCISAILRNTLYVRKVNNNIVVLILFNSNEAVVRNG